jgi:hypothetical protein
VAYWVSASKAPLNHAPPKAAELYCVRSFSLIKNLLQARNPFFSSPFNTQGHKGGGWEGDGLLVGCEKTPSHHPLPPLEGEGIHHHQLLPHYRRIGQTSLRPPAKPEAYLSEVNHYFPKKSGDEIRSGTPIP